MEEKPLVEYLLSGISTVMCSRIELKVSKTKHKQLQQAGGTFAMQLACARCQTHQSQNWFHLKPQDTVVVSHV